MTLEDKLEKFICDYIFDHSKRPEKIILNVEQFRELNKPKKFRGIPIVLKYNGEIVLDCENNKVFSEKEEQIIKHTREYLDYIENSLSNDDLQSEEFKRSMVSLLSIALNKVNDKEIY